MTIGSLIRNGTLELADSGILTADLDARLLLEDVLKKDSNFFFSHPESPISNPAYQKFRRYLRRRKIGEPVAYILGWKEFYGLRFKVNKNVLIPRPETEQMIEVTLEFVESLLQVPKALPQLRVLDVGTGSGAIIISLAKTLQPKYNNIRYFASDISEKALKIAKDNAKSNNVDGFIKFYQSDLLHNSQLPQKLDIILANLPYGPRGIKNPRINYHNLSFEPQNALFADKKGLDLIERMIIQISEREYKPKLIALEIFEDHPEPIKKLAEKYLPGYSVEIKKDYANLNRLAIIS